MTDLVPVITPALVVTRDERTVALRDLGIARENLRFNAPPDDDIPLLAATLRAAGQLERLTVRPGRGRKERAFMALNGRRRLLALGLLLEAGDIDGDYPVEVYVETDPARQAAAVLLTNTAVPVHVADVIAAIGRMLKAKLTIETMARALGYRPTLGGRDRPTGQLRSSAGTARSWDRAVAGRRAQLRSGGCERL